MSDNDTRKILYMGSSLKDMRKLPQDVSEVFNYGFEIAVRGGKHPDAKPCEGFSGSTVLKIVADEKNNTYRAVYTVQFKKAVYVLHVFQKKSKQGKTTPKKDLDLIQKRLKDAKIDYKERFNGKD